MTMNYFSKCLKFSEDFRNGKKIAKNYFVFSIIAIELAVANCQNPEQDTSYRQSMC